MFFKHQAIDPHIKNLALYIPEKNKMSSKNSSPLMIKKTNISACSGIKKSLFRRQLISSIIITILGLLLFSGLYNYIKQHSFVENSLTSAIIIEKEILGLFNYNRATERFYIENEELPKAKKILEKYKLINSNDKNFTYIIDIDSNQIMWHSEAFDTVNYTNSKNPPYPEDHLNALPVLATNKNITKGNNEIEILPSKNAINATEKDYHYLAYRSFFSEGPERKRNYHIVIAKSTQAMEKSKSDLLQQTGALILLTFILTVIAQFFNG
jgi:hypothetical protein